ncbi:MAG: hypothetical protein V4492_05125, partial [Chlamydiota bacterium]
MPITSIDNVNLFQNHTPQNFACPKHQAELANALAPDLKQLLESPYFQREFASILPPNPSDHANVHIYLTDNTISVNRPGAPNLTIDINIRVPDPKFLELHRAIIQKANGIYERCRNGLNRKAAQAQILNERDAAHAQIAQLTAQITELQQQIIAQQQINADITGQLGNLQYQLAQAHTALDTERAHNAHLAAQLAAAATTG